MLLCVPGFTSVVFPKSVIFYKSINCNFLDEGLPGLPLANTIVGNTIVMHLDDSPI
jgi:hypothetical protein